MGQTTITVSEETLQRFNEFKENTGDDTVPELSSDQFVGSLLDAWGENGESIYGDQYDGAKLPDLVDELSADLHPDVREQLDRIESAASTAEERMGTIERKVDELGGR